jgi:hypothetical protein
LGNAKCNFGALLGAIEHANQLIRLVRKGAYKKEDKVGYIVRKGQVRILPSHEAPYSVNRF